MPTYEGVLDCPTFQTVRRFFFREPKNVAFLVHSLDFSKEAVLVYGEKRRAFFERMQFFKPKDGTRADIINSTFAQYALKPIGQFEITFRGRHCYGIFIFVPYLPEEFQDPAKKAEIISSLKQAIVVAKQHGVEYIGLGAFTSIISANGLLLYNDSPLPLTSGSSGTAVWNEQGVLLGCKSLGIRMNKSTLMVLGTGSVGTPTAMLLAQRFKRTILCARGRSDLEMLRSNLIRLGCKPDRIEVINSDFTAAARRSDVLVLATSVATSTQLELDFTQIKPGSLVLDVGRPRNFPSGIASTAPFLVIDGAICRFPGRILDDSYKLVGMGQPDEAWGCLAETIFRGLDGEQVSTSIGNFTRKDFQEAFKALKILSTKMHRCGFELAALRSNDVALDEGRIKEVRLIRQAQSKIHHKIQKIKQNLNQNWERFAGRPNEQLGAH